MPSVAALLCTWDVVQPTVDKHDSRTTPRSTRPCSDTATSTSATPCSTAIATRMRTLRHDTDVTEATGTRPLHTPNPYTDATRIAKHVRPQENTPPDSRLAGSCPICSVLTRFFSTSAATPATSPHDATCKPINTSPDTLPPEYSASVSRCSATSMVARPSPKAMSQWTVYRRPRQRARQPRREPPTAGLSICSLRRSQKNSRARRGKRLTARSTNPPGCHIGGGGR